MKPPSRLPIGKVFAAAFAAAAAVCVSPASAQTVVDLELFLSIDTSGSVDNSEYDLQKNGYVQAFQSAAVQSAIASKPNGVAVALAQWSSTADPQLPAVNWTVLRNAADSNAFASAISSISRQSSGNTCVACGINAAVSSIQSNNFIGAAVIDVSGDGTQNLDATNGPASAAGARDAAAALGIKINGLPILGGDFGLEQWYKDNVQTANGFTLPAADFQSFNTAIETKLGKEISGGGVPGPLPLVGAGVAFGYSRRLRKRLAAGSKA
ncbi:MAG: DUF1194 domain-containing protein [Synechococcaceae cyanobacterium]|nr:DUF1194 domain-containing protein [Synechococcaceae cyanobacterium]